MASPVGLERPSNLPLDSSKPKPRVSFSEKVENIIIPEREANSTSTFRKFRCENEFRGKRKRANSCSFSFDHLSNKRRRAIILPTKFLLGGSITDPLNLEALDKGDDTANEENAGTAVRRGGTVQVIIPPNINDPLNLDACSEDGDVQLADAISRQRRRRKFRKRKRRNSEPGNMTYEPQPVNRLSTSLEDSSSSLLDVLPLPAGTDAKNTTSTPVVPPRPTEPSTVSALPTVSPVKRRASDPTMSGLDRERNNITFQTCSSTPRTPQPKRQRSKSEDKIVSPVVPQPGTERKRHPSYSRQHSSEKPNAPTTSSQSQSTSSQSCSCSQTNSSQSCSCPQPSSSQPIPKAKCVFQYGNYNQYYGYRNMDHKIDQRLKVFDQDWFVGKRVLDIGCNIGHITLSIAKEFCPQRVVGIDIDKKLINIAQKNIKHYFKKASAEEREFPSSMRTIYGPLKPPVSGSGSKNFPYNVKFYSSNYVLESDALLDTVRPEFDVILCLSVTKWIHLNHGDQGLLRFFKRMYKNLEPGGMLILEPQAWPSYKKKKKLTAEIFENYKSIRIYPSKFQEVLTKQIGFTLCAKHSIQHISKGFERPIYIYKKIVDCPAEASVGSVVDGSKVEPSTSAAEAESAKEDLRSTDVSSSSHSPVQMQSCDTKPREPLSNNEKCDILPDPIGQGNSGSNIQCVSSVEEKKNTSLNNKSSSIEEENTCGSSTGSSQVKTTVGSSMEPSSTYIEVVLPGSETKSPLSSQVHTELSVREPDSSQMEYEESGSISQQSSLQMEPEVSSSNNEPSNLSLVKSESSGSDNVSSQSSVIRTEPSGSNRETSSSSQVLPEFSGSNIESSGSSQVIAESSGSNIESSGSQIVAESCGSSNESSGSHGIPECNGSNREPSGSIQVIPESSGSNKVLSNSSSNVEISGSQVSSISSQNTNTAGSNTEPYVLPEEFSDSNKPQAGSTTENEPESSSRTMGDHESSGSDVR